ncbi:quinol monooxygenase YgiN [Agrobacterium vitis]|nr:quinol monooxygenase YgiN [Agrobacterium vitis]
MSDAKVFLNGHIDVPADRLTDVTAALPQHIALTRAEAGCLSFEVNPCPNKAGRFLVAEVFANQAAFDVHQARTKASNWFQVTAGIARDYTVRVGGQR